MKLQLALDDAALDPALALLDRVRPYFDIVEVGTPLIIEAGLAAVREIRKRFPDLSVLADLKIMDAGDVEARAAFAAGARYVTVLGVTDLLTVGACLNAAVDCSGTIVVDMICVDDLAQRVRELEAIGATALAVHTGVDQQAAGRTPADDLTTIKAASRRSEIFVAGGITAETIGQYRRLGADVAIIGGGIRNAVDPVAEAARLARLAKPEA